MIDYSYQDEHIDKIAKSLKKHKRVIAQQPTGAGKTWEFSKIVKRFHDKTGESVMILVHRRELLTQAADTLKEAVGMDARIINADTKMTVHAPVYVCMIESVMSRLDMVKDVKLIIIDEAHIANFNKIFEHFPDTKVIGFTATPVASSKKHPLKEYYDDIIVGEHISSLIKRGSLSQNVTRCPPEIVNLKNVKMDSFGMDYQIKSLSREYMKQRNVINTLRNYERFCKGKRTIVFNVDIKHSHQMNDLFNARGFKSKHLASDTNDQRDEILDWFRNTEGAILNNVVIATVGFDEPSVRSIILNLSTKSIVKFIQCAGRGGRKMEGKNFFDIIDMGGNYKMFGDWNQDRDWERLFWNPKKPGTGVAPMKSCPKCNGLLYASQMICTNINEFGELCGYEYPVKKIEEHEMGYAIVVTKDIDIEKMIGENKSISQYAVFFSLADEVIYRMLDKVDNPSKNMQIKFYKAYYQKCIEWYDRQLSGKPGYMKSIKHSAWHQQRAKRHFYKRLKEIKREYAKRA